jgi:hypothetical protein
VAAGRISRRHAHTCRGQTCQRRATSAAPRQPARHRARASPTRSAPCPRPTTAVAGQAPSEPRHADNRHPARRQ